jgi:hypothetical protein
MRGYRPRSLPSKSFLTRLSLAYRPSLYSFGTESVVEQPAKSRLQHYGDAAQSDRRRRFGETYCLSIRSSSHSALGGNVSPSGISLKIDVVGY